MPYRLKSATLGGIRGINKPFELEFDENITLLFGPNGSGKSSILQAIDWCITGSIPYMRGGDFTREDAIVNAFTKAKRASVVLSFVGEDEFKVSRMKNRTRSTTSGKQRLFLEADRPFVNAEAAEELERRLGVSLDEISRCKFLHQETIRQALTYKPAERSAVIEKLLGTYEIKEFLKALNQDRRINTAIKRLDVIVDSLRRDKIQFILNLKRNLEESKKALLSKGFAEDQLRMGWVVTEMDAVRDGIDIISNKIGKGRIIHPSLEPVVEALIDTSKRLSEDLTAIDRERMGRVQEFQSKKQSLESLSETYSNALKHFEDLKKADFEALEKRRKEITEEMEGVKKGAEDLTQKLAQLPSRRTLYEDTHKKLDDENKRLDEHLSVFGDKENINEKLINLADEQKSINTELEKFSGHQRIVNLSADLIDKTKTNSCPVCSQPIDALKIVSELRSQVSKDISSRIERLNDKMREYKETTTTLTDALRDLNSMRDTVKTLERRLIEASKSLAEIIDADPETVELDIIQADWEHQLQVLQGKLTELGTEDGTIEEKLKQRDFIIEEINNTQTQLQKETETNLEGDKLLEVALHEREEADRKLKELRDTSQIDECRGKITTLTDIVSYLKDEEKAKAAEKELPTLTKQIEDFESRQASLQLLGGSLNSIRKTVTEYQKEASLSQLRNLEDKFNSYYSEILGHPHYYRLMIDVEKEDPLQFSIKATSDREDTYIPTRFSTSQLNVAALSIFISNSALLAGDLSILIFDDPTQNMDDQHKEAFTKLIADLSKEYQILIATEDDETKEYLLQHCSEIKYFEMGEWTTEGPKISQK